MEGFARDLKVALSDPRLEAYRPEGGDDLAMLGDYFWNLKLAQALMPSLHAVEVGLRNAVHTTMSREFEDEFWCFRPGVLEPQQLKDFAIAFGKTRRDDGPVAGRVVAQLMFGFWVALFNAPYEQRIWSTDGFRRLYAVFPHARDASDARVSRKAIHDRPELINEIRNRVSHHEKIHHWTYRRDTRRAVARTAEADHGDIVQVLEWLSPMLREAIATIDDFEMAWSERHELRAALAGRFSSPD